MTAKCVETALPGHIACSPILVRRKALLRALLF
jgi:hypothetical protein